MSRLKWDQTGEKLYEIGTRHGVVYPISTTGEYPKGYAWNGLTAVNLNPSGADKTDLWADDIKYLSMRAAEDFGFTIEAYMSPPEFDECDGSVNVVDGIKVGQQSRKPFGFSYRSIIGNDSMLDDYGYKIHLIYNSTASPSEKSYSTKNDSPDAMQLSWEASSTPVPVRINNEDKTTCLLEIDSTKVPADKLAALEDILYGTEDSDARLPLPDEVISLFESPDGEG